MFVNTLKPTFLVGYCFMRRKSSNYSGYQLNQVLPGAKGMPRRASRIAPNTGIEFFLTVEI